MDRVLRASQVSYQELLQTPNFQELVRWLEELQNDLLMFVREKTQVILGLSLRPSALFTTTMIRDLTSRSGSPYWPYTIVFSTVFKDHLGISYSDYLTNLRIAKAKELLQTSSYRVYEISHLVGYPNHYYFNRLFKKVVGMTPLDYRRLKKTTN